LFDIHLFLLGFNYDMIIWT